MTPKEPSFKDYWLVYLGAIPFFILVFGGPSNVWVAVALAALVAIPVGIWGLGRWWWESLPAQRQRRAEQLRRYRMGVEREQARMRAYVLWDELHLQHPSPERRAELERQEQAARDEYNALIEAWCREAGIITE
jgi:hypothetical protein